MKAFAAVAASAAVANAVASPAKVEARASLPTVTVKGNAFFAGSDRFYIKGWSDRTAKSELSLI